MWRPFGDGTTIGQRGGEEGIIIRDEEHDSGARITLEKDCPRGVPFIITCGIYGWFFHTRRFGSEADAEFTAMQNELAAIITIIPTVDDVAGDSKMGDVCEAISRFVSRFP